MTHIVKAELTRLVRRRTIVGGAAGSVVFALIAAWSVFGAAEAARSPIAQGPRVGTTLTTLGGAGGGTEAFAVGASFVGFFIFVSFIALIAGEFSSGTFRALLMRDPHRLRVVVGKLIGILLVTAGIVALTEAMTFLTSLLFAPTRDVGTSEWVSVAGLASGLRNYGTVMAGVAGWAVFGTTLAVVFRSVPIALGVGFLWAGPFENITVDSWTTGYRVFPGQLLASLIQGGTPDVTMTRAAATILLYTAVAGAVTLVLLAKRDVTA